MYNTSFLIPSCDKYSDLWKPFFSLFWRYWQSDLFPVFLGANNLRYADDRVKTIRVGNDQGWSDGLLKMLEVIDTRYVILMLDDFFLRSVVNGNQILQCIRATVDMDGHMLRLVPRPRPDHPVSDFSFIGSIGNASPYRVSTQGAIWKKKTLQNLLDRNESIWEFEINGTERSREIQNGFYSVWKPVLTYHHHVIERGKWFRREARKFGSMNIGCDFNARPTMSEKETYFWYIKKLISYPQNRIPWLFRQKTKEVIRNRLALLKKTIQ